MIDPTDDPDFAAITDGIREMIPSARRGAVEEMRVEKLITDEQAELILRLVVGADRPSN
jgi:hypothetical protein